MSKKNFKNEFNPALQFISTSNGEQHQPAERTSQEQAPQRVVPEVPIKRNPLYIETKSKRVQLLMQPSLHSKLQAMAGQKDTSLNELIHSILEQITKKSK